MKDLHFQTGIPNEDGFYLLAVDPPLFIWTVADGYENGVFITDHGKEIPADEVAFWAKLPKEET